MATVDPFRVLGLSSSATRTEVIAARRRLALSAHPDRGGDELAMVEINAAVDAALAIIEHGQGGGVPRSGRGRRSDPRSAQPRSTQPTRSRDGAARQRRRYGAPVEIDQSTFVIEALPALAYEALLLAFVALGDASVQDPPYLLIGDLADPVRCWCQLDLVPEAGASMISMAVAQLPGSPAVALETVRDAFIAELNALDWGELSR